MSGSGVRSDNSAADAHTAKVFVRGFLHRLQYTPPDTPGNPELRREVADIIASWNAGLDQECIDGLMDTGCSIAQCAYSHTSREHQRFVAIYTACLVYIDDLGHRNLEALEQFVRRFTRGEPQLHPALDCLTNLLRTTLHELWAPVSADAILISTFDTVTAMYVEVVSQGSVVSPFAKRYPYYLRLKVGDAPAYAHFNFTRSWADSMGLYYLQILPELELMTIGFNLSFYKETLAGDTDNYVHIRARVEQKPASAVLGELVEENLQSWSKAKQIASIQPGLVDICVSHCMGYVKFHFEAHRYRLLEIVDQS
ncbi:hypothetical protein V8D89_001367 [Ganoderma adspersum]